MPPFETHPVVMWELTRACDLHCRNCTIGATESRGPNELTTYEAYKTIDQIASLAPREFMITGGDPLERPDLDQIVNYARRRGLDPALVAVPTSKLSTDAIGRLERTGLSRIVFSIDGSDAEIHEAFRGVRGTFAETIGAASFATSAGLSVEVNTLVTRRNAEDLPAIAELLRSIPVVRWNLYFPVPLRVPLSDMMTAAECEQIFGVIDGLRNEEKFAIRVVEAPHYRRYRLQQTLHDRLVNLDSGEWADFSGYEADDGSTIDEVMDCALDGARGFVFISHAGDVRASEFLLSSAGNLRYRPLGVIYRGSDLFVAMRDPANLTGKCGRCEFRRICGGSRARALAFEGTLFADDPLCLYQPGLEMPMPIVNAPQQEA